MKDVLCLAHTALASREIFPAIPLGRPGRDKNDIIVLTNLLHAPGMDYWRHRTQEVSICKFSDSQVLDVVWSERGEACLQRSIVDVEVANAASFEVPETSEAPTKFRIRYMLRGNVCLLGTLLMGQRSFPSRVGTKRPSRPEGIGRGGVHPAARSIFRSSMNSSMNDWFEEAQSPGGPASTITATTYPRTKQSYMRWLLTILRDHPHVFKAGLSSALEYSVDAPSGENHVLLRPWRTTNRQTEFLNVEGRLQYVRTTLWPRITFVVEWLHTSKNSRTSCPVPYKSPTLMCITQL